MGRGANLGFHSYESEFKDLDADFLDMQKLLHEEQKRDAELFTKQGIGQPFIDRVFKASSDDMWYPTTNELVENNVIHGFVSNSDINPIAYHTSKVEETEKVFKKILLFETIKKHNPKLYDTILSEFKLQLESGASQIEIQTKLGNYVDKLFIQLLHKSSNSAVISFVQSGIKQLDKLKQIEPVLCLKYIYPEILGEIDPTLYFNTNEMLDYIETKNRVMVDAYEKENPPLDMLKAQEAFEDVAVNYFSNKKTYEFNQLNSREDYLYACELEIGFLQRILKEDQETAANIFKFIFSPDN